MCNADFPGCGKTDKVAQANASDAKEFPTVAEAISGRIVEINGR